MVQVMEKNIVDVMKERSSVRKYKKGLRIPKETLDQILSAAGTAPSSWNLQHWKFIVVEDEARKERLLPISYNQQQVADASAVIIVLGDLEANKNALKIYENAPEHVREALTRNIENAYKLEDTGMLEAIKNSSYATMQLMLAAKAFDLDTCPMGGFNSEALIKELNIPDRYIPVLMMSIGYAESPAHPTERFSIEDTVVRETF
ncbi:nitroreductase family protein [Bacillus sp. 31A1R]|uniref:Nitroreductase family protein n=1 Tax=Robertmurraya mangrovi TaxID=3098077 RepID=A0ABU5IWJ3_9BACI|nr:nitroreductase family protein [Bacillus sp. 31A1R]MDZ5471543.1 nitroreductase family protein [Bacillus sp. 31A1R]